MSSTQQVGVVTGAAGGIGAAVVDALVNAGMRVAALDTKPTTERAGVTSYQVDVRNPVAVEDAVAEVAERFGRIDALVTAAAVLECAAVDDTPQDMWDRVMGVNVTGTFLASKFCLPHLRRVGGRIVVLSSVHAVSSVPRTAVYATSKAAVLGLANQMAVEYADDGVRVNAVLIGSVNTEMSVRHGSFLARDGITLRGYEGALGRMANPDEIASVVKFLASAESSFVNGSVVRADGGLLSRLV